MPWIWGALTIAAASGIAGYWIGTRAGEASAALARQQTALAQAACSAQTAQREIDHRRALAALVEQRNSAEARRGEVERARQAAETRAANAARRLASERASAELALATALDRSDCAVGADAIRLLDDATGSGFAAD